MSTDKRLNLIKKDISQKINSKLGFSTLFIEEITEDLINFLKIIIKKKGIVIKNFGTFKTVNKSERMGRNPKDKKLYKITARKSLIFVSSKSLIKKIRNF
tara:strand:+ start:2802 stop:3101 length:300 start_codon:yes stop_codon:yes gene_type:complete